MNASKLRMGMTGMLAGAALLALTACGGSSDSSEGTSEPTTLTVGLIPIIDVAPIYVGIEEGFFEEQGLKIEPVLASGGAAIVPAVTSESYQIGFSNNVSLMIGQSKGLPLQTFAPGVGVSPDTESSKKNVGYCGVVSSGTGDIKDTSDLDGATIAVNTLNNIGDVTITPILEDKGVDVDSVSFVEMPFPDMPAALEGGHVDAVWVCEPFMTSLMDKGDNPLFNNYGEVDDNLPVASYFTSTKWAENNPEDLKGFTAALKKSMEYSSENPEAVRKVITEYTKIDSEVAGRIGLPDFPVEFNEDGLTKLIELSDNQGLLDESLTVEDFVQQP